MECGNEAAAVRTEFHGGSFAAALQGASGAQIFKAVAHVRQPLPRDSDRGAAARYRLSW